MFIGEKLLEGYLKQGLIDIAASQPLAAAVLSSLSEPEQEEAIQWLNETLSADTLLITQGYPRRAPTSPLVAIIVGGESEIDEPVGLFGEVLPQHNATATEWQGAWFQTTYRLLIMGDNADRVTYLSAFLKFTLLRYRTNLTQDGLYEQTVGISDLLPAEEFSNPQLQVFQRGITLSGKHFAEFPVAEVKTVTTLVTEPTWTPYPPSNSADIKERVTETV